MRDLVLMAVLAGALPAAFLRPWIGVLLWCWVSIMSPHKLAWALAGQPIAWIVGSVTLAGLVLFPRGIRRVPMRSTMVLMGLLWLWAGVSAWLAVYPGAARAELGEVSKMLLFVFVSTMLFQERGRLRWLIWVLVGSLGFYGVKGAVFSLMTGADHIVFGPPRSHFADNNHLALGLNMLLPLMIWLARSEERGWLRWTWFGVAGCSVLSVLFTYSRGGLLALVAVLGIILLRSRQRAAVIAVAVLVLVAALVLAPPHWFDRVASIADYEQDSSVQGRFNAWWFAWNLALERPLVGGGFGVFTEEMFQVHAPNPDDFAVGHSIYFDVLGTQGFVGLGLFLAMIASALWRSEILRRRLREKDPWLAGCAEAIHLSLLAFLVGGAFLSMAWNDVTYHLLAALVVVDVLAGPLVTRERQRPRPAWEQEETTPCAA